MDETDNQFSWSLGGRRLQKSLSPRGERLPQPPEDAKFHVVSQGNEGLEAFYPGDDVVDIVGLSVFGYQPYDQGTTGRDQTFAERLAPGYGRVMTMAKPIMVAELGYEGGGS